MSQTEIELNYEDFKERAESSEKTIRRILKTVIRGAPKDTVIKVLKELKIIKNDLNLKTDKLELQERK